MEYKRSRFFACAIVLRKAISALKKQVQPKGIDSDHHVVNKADRSKSDVKWTDIGMLIITGVLTVATILLYREATHQSAQAELAARAAISAVQETKSADSLNWEQFQESRPRLISNVTFIWRHPYREISYYGHRHLQFQFSFFNTDPSTIEVPFYRYKIVFKYNHALADSGFYEGLKLNTGNKPQELFYLNTSNPEGVTGVIPLRVDTTLTTQDSISLERDGALVYLEIHYYNTFTNEKYKYQFLGRLDGENKKDHSGEYIDQLKFWKEAYWAKPHMPDN